jgi:hypothetical protein
MPNCVKSVWHDFSLKEWFADDPGDEFVAPIVVLVPRFSQADAKEVQQATTAGHLKPDLGIDVNTAFFSPYAGVCSGNGCCPDLFKV